MFGRGRNTPHHGPAHGHNHHSGPPHGPDHHHGPAHGRNHHSGPPHGPDHHHGPAHGHNHHSGPPHGSDHHHGPAHGHNHHSGPPHGPDHHHGPAHGHDHHHKGPHHQPCQPVVVPVPVPVPVREPVPAHHHHHHQHHHVVPVPVPVPVSVPVPAQMHHDRPHFDRNKRWRIRSADPEAHPGFVLTVHSHYNTDKRGPQSEYACIHKPGWKGCSFMIEEAADHTFTITMGQDTDYKHTIGRRLAGHNSLPTDQVDHMHTRAVLVEAGHPGEHWHIRKTPHGTYVITLADGPLRGWQLCPKYQNNARGGGKSFYVSLVQPGPHPEPHWAIEC